MKHLRILALMAAVALPCIAAARDYHVSPRGNDKAEGTLSKPLRTVSCALGKLAGSTDTENRIVLLDGTYGIEETIVLKGLGNLRLEAAPGASPVIRGDLVLKRPVSVKDKAVLSRIAPTAREHVLQVNLRKAGIGDCGSACVRDNRIDLYCDGIRQQLARYPDEGFLVSGNALGPTPKSPFGTEEGIFSYKEDRVSSWAGESDAWLFGYFYWDWWDSVVPVESIDTQKKVITLGNEPFAVKSGFRYYGVNLLCELDRPGEYYIDRKTSTLYWYPPEGWTGKEETSVSRFAGDYMLDIQDCSGITVKGISFAGGRENAINVNSSSSISFNDVTVSRFGGDALKISDSRDVVVEGCTFQTLGHSGIRAGGGNRKTLEKAGYVISNTLIKDFSLFKHTYEPAVLFGGCGLTISHCEFCGSYSSAMRIDGSEVLIEYNHFHDLVTESDDQGGLDMYYNYGYRGVVIRYNLWENILGGSLHGAAGVRFDDMISGQTVFGNIFNNVGSIHFGGVQIHGGKDNVVDNNVFYHCLCAVSLSPWSAERWKEAFEREDVRNHVHGQVEIDGELYRDRFPELREDPVANPNRNYIRNNLAVGCRQFSISESGQNVLENNNSILMGNDPATGPLEEYLDPAFLAKFGLSPIPLHKMGRFKD